MHYYKRNLGDYAKKCGRLSMLQHGAYTLLIDSCYDREQFPTLEEAYDWTWASTKEEREAVEFVLSRFFDLVEGRYIQRRIEEEVNVYLANCATNQRIAQERETNRSKQSTKRVRSVNEPPPNQEPLTINQEPVLAAKRRTQLPEGFLPNELGRAKAGEKGLSVETELAKFSDYHRAKGSVMLDWQAAWRTWIGNARTAVADVARQTVPSSPGRDPALIKVEEDAKRAAPIPESIRNQIAQLTRRAA